VQIIRNDGTMMKWRPTALALVVLTSLMTFGAAPGWAGATGKGTAGSGFPQYTYHADAVKGCKGDSVVWGSSANKGVYYVDGVGPERIGGFYACMSAVKKAGYKVVTS